MPDATTDPPAVPFPSTVTGTAWLRTTLGVLASAACYYLSTRLAWVLCFPDSKVSLFFPPHAILVSVLLLVPTRHWWVYVLAALSSHFLATQQALWPPDYALQCEAYDGVTVLLTALGIRHFVKSPFHLITLREAIFFVLFAVFLVPFGTAFWGAAFTVSYGYGTNYWIEWRNLGISNGVTTIVLVPVILIGTQWARDGFAGGWGRLLEAGLLGAATWLVSWFTFYWAPTGPNSSPALLYAPIPLLIWAALRFGLGGTCAAVLAITMLAIWGTMHGGGPFLQHTPPENALALQLFILMASTPVMLLAVAIDDERRSKAALRASEERMSLTAESAQIAMWEWHVGSNRVWVRDGGLFGFDPAVPLDHSTLAGRVHPDDRAARDKAIRNALENGGTYESEFRIVLPDGSIRWIAARGRSSSRAANPPNLRILGVAMDVTDKKQDIANAELQRDELAHLSRVATLSALSVSLAHELSQPLSSILMNAEAGQLGMKKDPPDLSEMHDILADIIAADSRAGAIIDRMRAMVRRSPIALQPVNVHECLEDLLRLTRSDLISRGVSVENLTRPDTPLAKTDRVQLQQVLLNLIMNACDAMRSNPAEDRILTLTTSVGQKEICIGVLDRGVGLPADIDSLFNPFHSTKPGGLGMGLSICRMLVEAQGGRLWAERRRERGAAFCVALPLA
jgi:PAS domain S-box-containing protein